MNGTTDFIGVVFIGAGTAHLVLAGSVLLRRLDAAKLVEQTTRNLGLGLGCILVGSAFIINVPSVWVRVILAVVLQFVAATYLGKSLSARTSTDEGGKPNQI